MIDRRSFAALLAATAALPHSALAAGDMLDPDAMRADVALLRLAYDALHPGLLRYNRPAQIEAHFARLDAACARPLPLGGFYVALSRLLAQVRCGHSYANFYNQKKAVRAALFQNRDRLPFHFRWLGETMVVTGDPLGIGLARGTIVGAVDGRPSRDILAALLPLARADGHNDAKRRMLLSVTGQDEYETFDIFYPLVFGGGGNYRLTLREPDGRHRVATVEAVGLEQRRAGRTAPADIDAPRWRFERRGRAAVLTMPDWGLYDSKWDWRGWLDARIGTIGDAAGLVIDIRDNEGGMDCGDHVAAYLTETPIPPEPGQHLVRYRRVPGALAPYLDTWDKSFLDWGGDAVRVNERFYRLDRWRKGDEAVIKPIGPRFRGKVAVLTSAQNSSATFQFAAMMKSRRLATLVGEETGGNRRGINGSAFFFLRLPRTGVEVDIPLVGMFPATPQPDAGVRPDVAVPLTAGAIAAGRDDAMARALAIVGCALPRPRRAR